MRARSIAAVFVLVLALAVAFAACVPEVGRPGGSATGSRVTAIARNAMPLLWSCRRKFARSSSQPSSTQMQPVKAPRRATTALPSTENGLSRHGCTPERISRRFPVCICPRPAV